MTKRRIFTQEERMEVLNKTNGHCAYCGMKLEITYMQIDHIHPHSRGGTNDLNNLMPACRSCNHYKGATTIESFRDTVSRMPKVLMRDSVTYRNAVRFGLVIPNPKPVIFYFERMNEV